MRKKILLLIIGLLSFFSIMAADDDLIVTTNGNRISCSIYKFEDNKIYYYFSYDRDQIISISQDKVASFKRGGTKKETAVSPAPVSSSSFSNDYDRLRTGVSLGWGYITNSNYDFSDVDARNGFNLDADITYFFDKINGIGLKYNGFHAVKNTDLPSSNSYYKDVINNYYIGLSGITRLPINDKNLVYLDASLGYLSYTEKGSTVGQKIKTKANAFAATIGLSYDYKFANHWAMTFTTYYMLYNIQKTHIEDIGDIILDPSLNLGRIAVTLGVRFLK